MADSPAPIATDELRRTTRVSVSWRARVLTGPSAVVDCRTFDISLGGVGLLCSEPLNKGAVMLVALQLPPTASAESHVVSSRAKPVFQILSGREYRIGMQWVDPADPALASLNAWSSRRV